MCSNTGTVILTTQQQGEAYEELLAMTETRHMIKLELPSGSSLGIAITPPKQGIAIHGLKINKVQNELFVGKIHHGDLLVEIGGTKLDGMKFADAVNLIKTMQRPLQLTFEVVPAHLRKKKINHIESDSMDVDLPTYTVVFDEEKMGMALEDGAPIGIDGAIVKGVRNQAEEAGIAPGDIVYKVNGTEVLFMSLKQVQNLIKATLPPRSVDFIPKANLPDVQEMIRNMSDSEKSMRMTRMKPVMTEKRIGETNEKSITEIIKENRSTVIKKGAMYKQGRVVKNWKKRHMVLCVTKLEYFKDAKDTTVQGVVNFENLRCTVRSLPSTAAKSNSAPGEYLLELVAGDRIFVMSCLSEREKEEWLEALKLAIDASKAVCRTMDEAAALRETELLRTNSSSSSSSTNMNVRNHTMPLKDNKSLRFSYGLPGVDVPSSMSIQHINHSHHSRDIDGESLGRLSSTVEIEVLSIHNLSTKSIFHVVRQMILIIMYEVIHVYIYIDGS
jgi:hypothetical protein